ncbi:MAG TPA: hypothetical protein VJN95_16080 [Gemmatimonadales bacterium]|nr:hypothetical protein [Gemmatimonadales bacterium]
MMNRRLGFAAALALLAAACSDPAGTAPSSSDIRPDAALVPQYACPNDPSVVKQILILFPRGGGLEATAEIKFLAIRVAVAINKPATAQTLAYNFVAWTLGYYNAGQLTGGKSADTQAKLTTLINAAYCAAGLTVPTIPPGSLGSDGAVALVTPTSPTTNVVTPSLTAGIQVPTGAVTQPTIITVTRLPDSQRLLTQLDQYPLYYQFTASPALPFGANAVVGVCIANSLTPPDLSRLRVAHNVPDPNPTTIEILPLAPVPFLDCTNASLSLGPNPSLGQFVRWGLASVGRKLARLIAPTPLYASFGGAGLGGTTRKLSPFGVVDTLLLVTPVSPTSLTGLASSSVASGDLPAVSVHTPTNVAVTNYPVSFAVPGGSQGSITGGTATTDATGVARITSWTLGAGLTIDSVIASVAAPHLNSGVQGSPVTFTDQVISTAAFSYQATNYRYVIVGNDAAPSGWETNAYSDASWSTGNAAFGSGPGSPDGCSLDPTVATTWPAAPTGFSDLLVRRTVLVPNGFAGSLKIDVAIDNDIQVFVNGHDVTGAPAGGSGLLTHEGCATLGSLSFTAPAAYLLPGQPNVIAVRARDRGRTSFFDMEANLVP